MDPRDRTGHHRAMACRAPGLLAIAGLIALTAVAGAAAAAAEPEPIPAAGWMAAIDIRALTSGRVGAWVARLAQDERIRARLAVARGSSGVDLLHDLSVCCACGPDADPAAAATSITGRFERDRIETLVLASAGSTVEPISAGRLLVVPHAVSGKCLYALLDRACGRLVLGIDRARVLAAQADPPQVDATRFGAALEHDASAIPLCWAACARMDAWQALPAQAEPARAIESAQALLEEKDGTLTLRAALVATSEAAAARYAAIVSGLCDLAEMEPHIRLDPALEALLASRSLALHGRRVDLQAVLSIELAERTWTPKIHAAMRP